MDSMAALPKDPLIEICSRVDNNKDLFMFAVTCRRWLRHFTDPVFLREICRGKGEGHHVRLLGFFQETRVKRFKRAFKLQSRENTSVSMPTFIPTPASPLGTIGRSLSSFFDVATVVEDAFNYAEPLVARRGIVLMNLIPRTFRDAHHSFDDINRPILIGLCNPITGECHVLPHLDFHSADVYHSRFAIIMAADSNNREQGRNIFSQLLIISQESECDAVYLHSYLANTRFWGAPTKCLDSHRVSMVGERSAIIHQGAAHWLCMDYVSGKHHGRDDNLYKLSVEVGTMRVSMTKLPIHAGGLPVLCVSSDNKLSVACIYTKHVTVWTQQEEDREKGDDSTPMSWLHTIIKIPEALPEPDYDQIWHYQCGARWYHFGKGSLLLVDESSAVFVLDINEKVMEKVTDRLLPHDDNQGWVLVPYEMGLVDFFGCRRPAFLLDDLETQDLEARE